MSFRAISLTGRNLIVVLHISVYRVEVINVIETVTNSSIAKGLGATNTDYTVYENSTDVELENIFWRTLNNMPYIDKPLFSGAKRLGPTYLLSRSVYELDIEEFLTLIFTYIQYRKKTLIKDLIVSIVISREISTIADGIVISEKGYQNIVDLIDDLYTIDCGFVLDSTMYPYYEQSYSVSPYILDFAFNNEESIFLAKNFKDKEEERLERLSSILAEDKLLGNIDTLDKLGVYLDATENR